MARAAREVGALRLTTIGRKSGEERSVIVGYLEDGPNLVTLAMNGWGAAEPAWWLNLQAHPECTLQLTEGRPRRPWWYSNPQVNPAEPSGSAQGPVEVGEEVAHVFDAHRQAD